MKTKKNIVAIINTLVHVKLTKDQEEYFLKELYRELGEYFGDYKLSNKEQNLVDIIIK